MKIKALLGLFGVIALLEIYAELTNNQQLIYAVKPLLMISLSLFYYLNIRSEKEAFNNLILFGLLFSIGGDTFLMFQGSQYFMAGLGCFLITHLCYIAAFQKYKPKEKGLLNQKKWLFLPFLLYLVVMLSYLWNDLNDLKIPVVIYSLVICLMAVFALHLKPKLPSKLFLLLFIGVLLFLFSDTIIALNKFKQETLTIPAPRIIIMITYIIAQSLIAISTLKMKP